MVNGMMLASWQAHNGHDRRSESAINTATRKHYQSKIAAAAARRNTTEAWRADAGLQLLQLSVWHDLKPLLQAVLVASHVFVAPATELQAPAEIPVCPPVPTVQE